MGRKPSIDPNLVYKTYYGPGKQSNTKTAEILGITPIKVYEYRRRYNFDRRAADDIEAIVGPAYDAARGHIALALSVGARYCADVIEDESQSTKDRLQAVRILMDQRLHTKEIKGPKSLTLIDARTIQGNKDAQGVSTMVSQLGSGDLSRRLVESLEHNIMEVDTVRNAKR